MTPPYETEKGFGTGLRSLLERKQNGEETEVAAVVTVAEPEARGHDQPPNTVEVIVTGTVPELETIRAELQAALEREHVAREEAHAACRAAAERETELGAWASDLEDREQAHVRRTEDLERDHRDLTERHTEIVAEYARIQELSSHAESRVEELESAEQDRVEAAASIARQVAEVAERERELKREAAAHAARHQEAEARIAKREHAVRERDDAVSQREMAVREAETSLAGSRARAEQREQALDQREGKLQDEARALEDRRVAVERTLDERGLALAEQEASLKAWEIRLQSESERLQDERSEHGQTSQDAFALMAELEARDSSLRKREQELLEAQARLQAVAEDPGRARELDEREAALVAREAELNRKLASAAREDRDNDLVERLRAELKKREDDVAAREQWFADSRERIDAREKRVQRSEQELVEQKAACERLEDDLRLKFARLEADLELREDALDERKRDVEEREARVDRREADLTQYVTSVQSQISAA